MSDKTSFRSGSGMLARRGGGERYAGMAGDGTGSAYLSAQFGYIRDRLKENLCYPAIARQRGWSGMVMVAFTIHPDGLVDNLEIKQSCGFALLDKSALKTVRNACPFPKPPMEARIIIPVHYQLN